MIKFKLNGKSINVASSWDDLTFDQFLQVLNGDGSYLGTIAICLNVPRETLEGKPILGLEALLEAIKFLQKPANYPQSTTTIGKYKLPLDSKGEFNPQFKRLDQFEDMRKIMIASDKGIKSITEAYASYCAIYLQELRDKEYSYSKAMAMVEEVKQMPAKEVIPAGSFFLIKLLSLSTGIKTTSPIIKLTKKKSKQASRKSKKSSGHTRPSTRSRLR
jgi:hypothetical protein